MDRTPDIVLAETPESSDDFAATPGEENNKANVQPATDTGSDKAEKAPGNEKKDPQAKQRVTLTVPVDDDEYEPQDNRSNDDATAQEAIDDMPGVKRPVPIGLSENAPAKRYVDSYHRAGAGSSAASRVLPPPRSQDPHLRNLPDINKCGSERTCGSLTREERKLLTSFFEKHPRRFKISLKEGLLFLNLYAWSKLVESDRDVLCYTVSVAKTFKCEDAFISHLLHDRTGGSPRMELRFDKCREAHFLFIKTIPEKRSTVQVLLHHSLGLEIRFYLFDA